MDGQRFDRLARRIATAAPRRTLFRAAAAAAAGALVAQVRGRDARAQDGGLPLGSPCSSAAQCTQLGGTTLCADNGYTDDGAFNCCRGEGGACFDSMYSADCCSGLYCRNGACTDLSVTGELPLGSYCVSTSQCSQTGGPTVCGDNGIAEDGTLNCCLMEGGACGTQDGYCCNNLFCVNGLCQPTVTDDGIDGGITDGTGTVAAGGACTSSSQCSGAAICADNGLASDGTLNCCLTEVNACTGDAQCCAGLICGDNYIAEDGPLTCCAPLGGACSSDAGCCDFGVCGDGICQTV